MTKISDLTAITGASVDTAADLIPIVDMSLAGTSRNKKILVSELGNALAAALAYTDEKAQDAIGAMIDSSLTYVDATPLLQRAALTGDVTASAGSNATTIANNAVSFAKFVAAPSAGVVWASGAANYAHNASGGGTTNFLRADGTWAAPPGSGGFTAASTTEVLTGTDSSKGVTPDSLAALWEQGSDVASAGTISVGEGGYFNITGTTTITDIDFATDKAGRKAWVKFAGALTLTHNASTLILPTAANITTAAGDTACFISEGSDAVRCVAYTRASGAALASSSGGWTELLYYDFASGASSTKECDVTGYKEILVTGYGLVHAAAAQRALNFSVDGGSTWYTSSGNYQDVSTAGVGGNNVGIFCHDTPTGSARDFTAHILDNDGRIPVAVNVVTRRVQQNFIASATAINRIRLVGLVTNAVSGSNFTAGTIRVRGRT